MARARNIKPAFFRNELLAEISTATRLLFIGLWCLADREGRLEDRPKRIKLEILPFDSIDVDAALNELAEHGFIKRYTVDGMALIQVVNFSKHQTPHGTERDSELPGEDGSLTVHQRGKNGYINSGQQSVNGVLTVNAPGKNTLNPDSLIPDSLNTTAQAPKRGKPAVVKPECVSDSVWQDFLAIRKAKRSPLTTTALRGIETEAGKAGLTLQEALQVCCTRGWQGFNAEWMNKAQNGQVQQKTFAQQAADIARTTVPGPVGPDPALMKIEEDRKRAAPMPENVRLMIQQATRKVG